MRPRRLELDGGEHRLPGLREHARRLGVAAEPRGRERPLERPLGGGEVALRLREAAQAEQHVARLARAPERLVGRERPLEPGVVAAGVVDLDLPEERRVERERLARAARAQSPLGALSQLDVLARGHQRSSAASSTISRARRRFSAPRASDSAVTTWWRCRRGR